MSDWREIQGRFSGFEGIRINFRRLIPREATCHTVMLVHGFGEHAGRYGHVFDYFVPKGYEFYAPDQRGHGLSEGKRGHVMRFSDYIEDLEALRAKIDSERPSNCRLEGGNIILGHSMGGLIALRYALDHPEKLSAVIVSGPMLKLAIPVPAWKAAMGKLMSKIAPALSMPNELDPGFLSHDPQVAPQYENDPLVNHMVSSRWFTEANAAMEDALARASQLKLPILIMHGGADKLCSPEGSKAFYEKCGSPDKTLKIYDGMYHEIFNELQYKQVLADVEAWLKARNL